jgi:hypothetical protein
VKHIGVLVTLREWLLENAMIVEGIIAELVFTIIILSRIVSLPLSICVRTALEKGMLKELI